MVTNTILSLIKSVMDWVGNLDLFGFKYRGALCKIKAEESKLARLELNKCLYHIKKHFKFLQIYFEEHMIFGGAPEDIFGEKDKQKLEEQKKISLDLFRFNREELASLINIKRAFYIPSLVKKSTKLLEFIGCELPNILRGDYEEMMSILDKQIMFVDKMLNYDFMKEAIELKSLKK